MTYVIEHFKPHTKTLKWSPRVKTLLFHYSLPYIQASIKLFQLLKGGSSLSLVSPLFHKIFSPFFRTGLFNLASDIAVIYQKKLTNTFTQSLHHNTLRLLSLNQSLQTDIISKELNQTTLYISSLKLPNIFFVQKTYIALLTFLQSILTLGWTQLNLQQSYVLSRHTLLDRDLLLRFYNLYFFKVSNF